MNIDQMTERLQRILMEAIQLAQAQGQSELNVEHCLKAIFEDDGIDGLWQRLGQDKQRTLQIVDSYMKRLPSSTSGAQPCLLYTSGNSPRFSCGFKPERTNESNDQPRSLCSIIKKRKRPPARPVCISR